MSEHRDPAVREIISQLIESAPPAPPLPDADMMLPPVRSSRVRRRSIAALAAGLVVIVGGVGWVAHSSGSNRSSSVSLRGGHPRQNADDPLAGHALPSSGLVILEDPRAAGGDETSYVPVLEDDAGTVLAQLPRATLSSDVTNSPWSVQLVASDTGVQIEHRALPDQTGAPAGCSITGSASSGSLQVAVCGIRSGDQLLGNRVVVNRGAGWSDLIASPPAPPGIKVDGHWEFATPSPNGRWVLAQWSGECEAPTAFLIGTTVADVHTVTGQASTAWVDAPESGTLGWTSKNDAVVVLPQGACGASAKGGPGVYLVAPGDRERLLFRGLSVGTTALRWTSVDDRRTDVDHTSTPVTVEPATVPTTPPTPPGAVDLVGDAPPIVIDHTGVYTWQSPVVLHGAPDQFNFSPHVNGHAEISNYHDTLVAVPGGLSLQITFSVVEFSGHPTVTLMSHAYGPYSSIPNGP